MESACGWRGVGRERVLYRLLVAAVINCHQLGVLEHTYSSLTVLDVRSPK